MASAPAAVLGAEPPACVADAEPNDGAEAAMPLAGAFCIEGEIGESDQDVFAWTISADDARRPWSIALTGLLGQQTRFQIHRLERPAEGDQPAEVGPELFALVSVPGTPQAGTEELFLQEGTYLVGLSVSGGSGGYSLAVTPAEAALQPEVEPNDTIETATAPEGALAIGGDLAGSEDWLAWTLGEREARQRWTISVRLPLGTAHELTLLNAEGEMIASTSQVIVGELALYDFGLSAADYRIKLAPAATAATPYSLRARSEGPISTSRENEPNDAIEYADALSLGRAMGGRIARFDDVDSFALPVEDAAGRRLEVSLESKGGMTRKLCLLDGEGGELQCRAGVAPKLADLVLGEGEHYVTVSGTENPKDTYSLTARVVAAGPEDAEAEPNDTIPTATALGAKRSVGGRFSGDETDTYRMTLDGEPGLWRFEATGENILTLDLLNARGESEGGAATAPEARGRIQIKDLFLTPGDYWVAISGADGTYALSASFAGKPDPDAEREPNDSDEDAPRLKIGDTRTGALTWPDDRDAYRFVLSAEDYVSITVEPGAGCRIEFNLGWATHAFDSPSAYAEGEPYRYEGLLKPGEYYVGLRPASECAAPYRLSLARLDPYAASGDVEPNNTPENARLMPPAFRLSGQVATLDRDWYRLPSFDVAKRVRARASGNVYLLLATGGIADQQIIANSGAEGFEATIEPGASAALQVEGEGAYDLEVAFDGYEIPGASDAAPFELALAVPETSVAAYWPRGQMLSAEIDLKNTSDAPLDLSLEARASHLAFHPRFAKPSLTLAPGASERVTLDVEIDPNAETDGQVQLAAQAVASNGARRSATAALQADPNAPPVNERQTYKLPEPLLGGFNVALAALGAKVIGPEGDIRTIDQANLHDGLTSTGGFVVGGNELPVTLTVGLGGGRSWPIAGVAINPEAPQIWLTEQLKDFELLLSADGASFEPAFSGSLSQLREEQGFVIDPPREATAAELRLLSGQAAGVFDKVGLGEWKLIVAPSATQGFGLNLADPVRGGHVVSSNPLIGDMPSTARGMLEEGDRGPIVEVKRGSVPEWVIGFHENRAAQIASLEWVDPPDEDAPNGFGAVRVAASLHGPLGPWTQIGTWAIERGDSDTATWAFETPVWARFLKFSAAQPMPDDGPLRYPTTIRVIERKTDEAYRSILGEWGHLSPVAIYEASVTRPPLVGEPEAASNDTHETAQSFDLAQSVVGEVEIGKDEDWYRIVIPPGQDTLSLTARNEPTVDVDFELQDTAGQPVPLRASGTTAQAISLEASVTAGETYYVRVMEPPHSVMIAYDTSGSLLLYTPIIFRGLESFAAGAEPGREAVNFMPFEQPPMMKDWSDQPLVLQAALAADSRESTSSGLEPTIAEAARALGARRGVRAILVLTDAATAAYQAQPAMWEVLSSVRPRIFAAHIGAFDDPMREKQLMQDLAMSNGGFYISARSDAEMDGVFEQVAAALRRPARYVLSAEARVAPPPVPAAIAVGRPAASPPSYELPSEPSDAISGGAIELVLDASGSMLQRLDGRRRIEIAQDGIAHLLQKSVPAGAPFAFRVFGHTRPGSCDTELFLPVQPLDAEAVIAQVRTVWPQNLAKTPIAAALRETASDLAGLDGPRTVILVTDGEETCDGDPKAEIEALRASGVDVRVNIVGFAVDDALLKERFRDWAQVGGGQYFDAANEAELNQALVEAAQVRFRILDASGTMVGEGMVDGAPVEVAAGTYRVEIGDGRVVYEAVAAPEGETVRLQYKE
ncbi:MAG: VWA domain-containing protein [Alphaproteobacteria bacterium]